MRQPIQEIIETRRPLIHKREQTLNDRVRSFQLIWVKLQKLKTVQLLFHPLPSDFKCHSSEDIDEKLAKAEEQEEEEEEEEDGEVYEGVK